MIALPQVRKIVERSVCFLRSIVLKKEMLFLPVSYLLCSLVLTSTDIAYVCICSICRCSICSI